MSSRHPVDRLQVEVRSRDGVEILAVVAGELTRFTGERFLAGLPSGLRSADTRWTLDLGELATIDATGLRVLAATVGEPAHGQFTLRRVPAHLLRILHRTGLSRLVTIETPPILEPAS